MKKRCFTPVMRTDPPGIESELRIAEPAAGCATIALYCDPDGVLHAQSVDGDGCGEISTAVANAALLGYLRYVDRDGAGDWLFVGHHRQLGLNGVSPPLPVMAIEPGALLSFRGDFWHCAQEWTPEVATPPEHLRERPCPVCGAPLSAAPAVECLCGCWTHLQKPEAPEDTEALNCFLHVGTCQCQRKTSLAPRKEPEVPAPLAGDQSWESW